MTGRSERLFRAMRVVGITGMVLTVAAAVVTESPGLVATLLPWLETFAQVVFVLSAVTGLIAGFVFNVAPFYLQWQDAPEERINEVETASAALLCLVPFGLVLITVDEIVAIGKRLLATYGIAVEPRLYFYGALVLFGAMSVSGLIDLAWRRRVGRAS